MSETPPIQPFANSLEHLLAEMERIDLLIRSQVARVRRLQTEDDQFRGLYISEQEVDALLEKPIGIPQWLGYESNRSADVQAALTHLARQIDSRRQASLASGIDLRLDKLQRLFGLAQFEMDALLVCMAVELDLRYEKLYAYLQDDVTRKKPSVDLILNLLGPSVESKLSARHCFASHAPLIRNQLLEAFEDPAQSRPPLLARYLKVDDRVTRYLLGSDDLDDRIRPYTSKVEPSKPLADLLLDEGIMRGLKGLSQQCRSSTRTVVHLRGPYGVGKQSAAEAVCHESGSSLLVVSLERLVSQDESAFGRILALINREAALQDAAICWKGFDALLSEQNQAAFTAFLSNLECGSGLTFVAGEASWEPADALRGASFHSVAIARPGLAEREQMWQAALNGSKFLDASLDLAGLSSKFKLTNGQIHDAAATAKNLAQWRARDSAAITMRDLYEACRLHSNQKLATLARKVMPKYRWADIVLPGDRVVQLREICNHVKYRARVYGDWGFDRKLSLGKGLAVLFAGPSGTGKTMAADIIAGELGLDLYKIDLSSVISKYIGETEKNLARIFGEAETSNAILFFDEADALFGKRSEVRDSHDRYANIEVGYLLQRMEEYEGVAILATNFRKNMDDAFVRRLQFTVDFPFPNQADRQRIWDNIWPEDTPRDRDLDLEFMARRFEITGGNIRNIALAAAFLAADDGSAVQMDHLIVATQREYQKMGKLIGEGEFKVGTTQ